MNIKCVKDCSGYDPSRKGFWISIDNRIVFDIREGEPEDMILLRDLQDCYKVSELMRLAHEAGKRGEEFLIEIEEVKDETKSRI